MGFLARVRSNFVGNRWVYALAVPVVVYYVVFKYLPAFGVMIAFQEYSPAKRFFDNEWVGIRHFIEFFSGPYAFRVVKNTFVLNLLQLAFGFPLPILLALLINEIAVVPVKRTIQTLTYLPHFISLVVVCGILTDFSMSTGLFSDLLVALGLERKNLLADGSLYRALYVGSGVWQSAGWGSIIYLATLSGIDLNLYEASVMDGANRLQQAVHITLPSLVPIIVVLLILRIGRIMDEGAEKTILLYSPLVYDKADIISSFVYRKGLQEMSYSFGTAIGLINSLVNMVLLVFANWFSREISGESLW